MGNRNSAVDKPEMRDAYAFQFNDNLILICLRRNFCFKSSGTKNTFNSTLSNIFPGHLLLRFPSRSRHEPRCPRTRQADLQVVHAIQTQLHFYRCLLSLGKLNTLWLFLKLKLFQIRVYGIFQGVQKKKTFSILQYLERIGFPERVSFYASVRGDPVDTYYNTWVHGYALFSSVQQDSSFFVLWLTFGFDHE